MFNPSEDARTFDDTYGETGDTQYIPASWVSQEPCILNGQPLPHFIGMPRAMYKRALKRKMQKMAEFNRRCKRAGIPF